MLENNKTMENIDDKLAVTNEDKFKEIQRIIDQMYIRICKLEADIEDLR